MNVIGTIGIIGFGIVLWIVGIIIIIQNPDNSLGIDTGWAFIAGGFIPIVGSVISIVKD